MSGIIEATNLQTANIKHTNGTTAATVGSGGIITATNNIVAPNLVTSPSIASYTWGAVDQDNAKTTIPASTILVNIGNDLASTGVYTCPVNGIYRASIFGMAGAALSQSSSTVFMVFLAVDDAYSSSSYFRKYVDPAGTYTDFSADIVIPANANQTLRWKLFEGYRTLHEGHGTASFKLEHQT